MNELIDVARRRVVCFMWIISFLIDVYTINLENNRRMPTLESALDGGDHVHNTLTTHTRYSQ